MRGTPWLVVVVGIGLCACSDPGGSGTTTDADGSIDVTFVGEAFDAALEAVGACTNGARQCVGLVAQQCVNGAWQTSASCRGDQICEAGECKTGEVTGDGSSQPDLIIGDSTPNETSDPCGARECGPDGRGGSCGSCLNSETCNAQGQCVSLCVPDCAGKECGNDLCGGSCGTCGNFEQCVQGSCELTQVCDCDGAVCGLDNCGNSCGTCSGQTTCSGGLCVSTATGGTCIDLLFCIFDELDGCFTAADQAEFDLCIDGCYASASATGVDEFDAYLGCLDACPSPDDDPNTTADDLAYARCSYQNCSDVEAFCWLDGSGSGTCVGILDCFDGCGAGDSDCFEGCYEQATPAAQVALWGINGCLSVECPDETDDACVDDALQGACFEFLSACQFN